MLVSDLSPKDVGYLTLIDIVHLHMECNYEERQLTIIELTNQLKECNPTRDFTM